jgi:hypothetical protein
VGIENGCFSWLQQYCWERMPRSRKERMGYEVMGMKYTNKIYSAEPGAWDMAVERAQLRTQRVVALA